jgi:hypothetical protein
VPVTVLVPAVLRAEAGGLPRIEVSTDGGRGWPGGCATSAVSCAGT